MDTAIVNPILVPVIAIAVLFAGRSAKPSTLRIIAVLAGGAVGYGLGASVNALATNIFSWLAGAHLIGGGQILDAGNIMAGLVIAGCSLGLLAAMFIREPADDAQPHTADEPAPQDHIRA